MHKEGGPQGQNGNKKLTMQQFSRKVSSRHDLVFALAYKGKYVGLVYIFGAIGQFYLPDKRYCTMQYLRDVLNGSKKAFKMDEVKKVQVPRYKQLALKHVLDHCKTSGECLRYLPDLTDNVEPQVDRDFVFSVLNTLDPDYFPS